MKTSLIAKALLLPVLALCASSCVTTVSRSLVGTDLQESPVGDGKADCYAELTQYPSYDSSVMKLKLSKTQTVQQSETKRYKTQKQLRTVSLLLPIGLGLGAATAWSATTSDGDLTKSLGICGGAALIASVLFWNHMTDIEGEETIHTESPAVLKKSALASTSVSVVTDDASVSPLRLRSSESGDLDLDLVRDLKIDAPQPRNIAISLKFEGNPKPATFALDTRQWTKPFFIVSDGTSGVIYADRKTSSAKLSTFKPGSRLELVSAEPMGSWLNVVVPGQRDGKTGWVLASAGAVSWQPKKR